MATNNAINLKTQGVTYYNGTGTFSGLDGSTAGFVLTSNGTGVAPSFQANAASIPWSFVAGTTQTAAVNTYYGATNAGQTTFTLPTTAAQGTVQAFLATTAAGFTIVYGTGQSIHVGSSTSTATTGSVTSTAIGDIVYLVCSTANTTWYATGDIGNLTIV